ncbi:MAG: hypothetical protein JST06_04130 [Bacteroidetes bacterium]|nr:hypothetical protein [Bacteroidota bacterium]MBS1628921.1 hypothetical protein [Bacteroidota bacterium]
MKWLFLALMLFSAGAAPAQKITLNELISLHSQEWAPLSNTLKMSGWREKGIQYDLPHKPQLFIILDGDEHPILLYAYRSRRSPLCKLELVSDDVYQFNKYIRDSLQHYGFFPDLVKRPAEEENLKVKSTALFVNHDLPQAMHALILYFEQRGRQMVSMTLYSDP